MEYTEVKKAHIVPRFYQKNFAVEDSVMLSVDSTPPIGPVSIDNAAIRRSFYRRFRPDGTPIYDVEWSLSELESFIAPLLPHVREGWPLPCIEVKAALAEFFAFQFVRGPRWKKWREDLAQEAADNFRPQSRACPSQRDLDPSDSATNQRDRGRIAQRDRMAYSDDDHC